MVDLIARCAEMFRNDVADLERSLDLMGRGILGTHRRIGSGPLEDTTQADIERMRGDIAEAKALLEQIEREHPHLAQPKGAA
jgi:hypothetical protein